MLPYLPVFRVFRSPAFRRHIIQTLHLALPLMLGELSGMLMSVADNIMIGRLGAIPLAASNLATSVYVFIMLLVWGTAMVLASPVAEAHERRDGLRVRMLFNASMITALLFTLLCGGAVWFIRLRLDFLGQDPAVAAAAAEYLFYIILGLPATIAFAVLVQFVDAFTLVRYSMVVSIFGLFADVFLNWVFIFGNLGFPALGMKGAAITSSITTTLMCAALIWIILKKDDLAYFRKARVYWADVKLQTIGLLKLGLPSGLQFMVENGAFIVGALLIGQLGAIPQAAHQIAMNLASVSFVTILGLSTAGAIRVGQALAYTSRVRVRLAGMACMTLAVVFMAVPMLLFLLFPNFLARIYIQDQAVITIAASLLMLGGLFQLFDGLQSSSLALLRALGDVQMPSLLSFVAFWLIGLPVGYLFSRYAGWGAQGIWLGYVVALAIQTFLFVRRFIKQSA